MSACNMDVIKLVGKYFDVPVGTVCYNTDKVLTTVLDKQNVEGFATIILRLAEKSGVNMSQEQRLLSYQWLEHIAMYANQAASNPAFAKNFLQDINRALEKMTYLTGHYLTVTDIAAYYVLYTIVERLTSVNSPVNIRFQLPKQLLPHELNNVSLEKPVVYHPQPFAFPGYPVILYL